MSRGINKVILVGHLGKDPEMRYTADQKAIARFSVATSESWTDKNTGQQQDKTEWHNVVIFGKTAEIAGQYLKKGSQVYLEGKLQTRKWQDQQGQDRYSTEVVIDIGGTMQMLGGRSGGGNVDHSGGYSAAPHQADYAAPPPPPAAPAPRAPAPTPPSPPPAQSFDDDVPF